MSSLPGEVSKTTYDRLAELTSLNGNGMSTLIAKKANTKYRNQYVAYGRTRDDALSTISGKSRSAVSQMSRRTVQHIP